MSELQTLFEAATAGAQNLPERPDNETLLQLYSLYKQATAGDVAGKRPGFTNPVGRAKYDAWKKQKGLGQEDAMQAYVDLVDSLKA
ncbi:MAG: acyl-CoA-binding protein [Chloroflexi bacterium]|nr:acyl-CoA-binding protein [Chloroflexota bacterium]